MCMTTETVITTKDLSVKTPQGPVFSDLCFEAKKAQTICFFGTEGSGKTSILLSLTGRMKESSGEATIAGYSLKQSSKIRSCTAISIIEGLNDVQPNLKVQKILSAELSLAGKRAKKEDVQTYLEQWNFAEFAQVRFSSLDAYDKAYFGIMLACVGEPQVLAVDDIQSDLTQHQSIKLVKVLKSYAQAKGCVVLFGCNEYEIACYAESMVITSDAALQQRLAVIKEHPQLERPLAGTVNGICCNASNNDKEGE